MRSLDKTALLQPEVENEEAADVSDEDKEDKDDCTEESYPLACCVCLVLAALVASPILARGLPRGGLQGAGHVRHSQSVVGGAALNVGLYTRGRARAPLVDGPPPPPPQPDSALLTRAIMRVMHDESDLHEVWRLKAVGGDAAQQLPPAAQAIPLPSRQRVREVMLTLARSSCAVVGAPRRNCSALASVCTHDVVIRLQDRAPSGSCQRTDVQVTNQHTCVPRLGHGSAELQQLVTYRSHWQQPRPCATRHPLLFRLRAEWTIDAVGGPEPSSRPPRDAAYYAATGAWLANPLALAAGPRTQPEDSALGAAAGRRLAERNASSGASSVVRALAPALALCHSVSLFGVGTRDQHVLHRAMEPTGKMSRAVFASHC
jgi:hypothetical protein